MAFKARYSAEQKEAIAEAVGVFGYNAKQLVAAARDGTLPGKGATVKPFDLKGSYAAYLATEERKRRRALEVAGTDPGDVIREGIGRLVQAWEHDVAAATVRRGKNKATPGQLRDLAAAGREIRKLAAELHPKPSGRAKPAAAEEPSGDDIGGTVSFIDALAAGQRPSA